MTNSIKSEPISFGWTRAAAAGLTFRPITDPDLPFLARVYASTRWEELSVVAWSDAEKLGSRRCRACALAEAL